MCTQKGASGLVRAGQEAEEKGEHRQSLDFVSKGEKGRAG